jgi:hypothetical protein
LTSLQWPEAAQAAVQGSDVELSVTKLAGMKWFLSPESQKQDAEASIQRFLSQLGAGSLPIRWLDKQQAAAFIAGYELIKDPIWMHLYGIPQTIKDAADAIGGQKLIAFTMDDVPEHLFHVIYDAAFHAFEQQGHQVISHVVAAALYLTSLSISWDAVCSEDNPLAGLMEVLKLGYLPLGAKDGAFYLV